MSRLAIIGQAPGRALGRPLGGRCGKFLAALAEVDSFEDVRARVWIRNVLDEWPGKSGKGDAFPMELAARRARRMRIPVGARVLFCGRLAAKAFGFEAPFLTWLPFGEGRAAIFPHPSGINTWWNDPARRESAGRFLRKFLEA